MVPVDRGDARVDERRREVGPVVRDEEERPAARRHEPEPGTSLPDMERDLVCRTLDRTDWNVTKSARMLGLSRDMLRDRIEKLGLVRPDKRQW